MNRDSHTLSCFSAILAGIIATVVGGLILAFILGEGPFQNEPTPDAQTRESISPTAQSQPDVEPPVQLPIETAETDSSMNLIEPTLAATQIPLPYTPLELPFNSSNEYNPPTEWVAAGPYEDIYLVGNPGWSNYMVDVDASTRVRSNFGYHVSMVLIHVQDLDNHVRFVIDCPDGIWWEIVKERASNIVFGTLNNNSPEVCEEFHLQLRTVDGNYEAYIDGELRSAFTDYTFSNGYVGLNSRPKVWEGSTMDFQNLVVSAP